MALDPIQQSPYTSYPYFQKDYNTAASFSQGFQDSQKEAMNRIAMDTAQQQQITADQAMRLRDLEEARKQILFKRQQGEWGRADAMAKTGIPGSSFTVSPYGGGSSIVGGENRLIPPVPGAGVTPAAPAAPPGPQSSVYEPSSEKPAWYNPQNVAGLRGVQVAQNTTTMNDASSSGAQLYGALNQYGTGNVGGVYIPGGIGVGSGVPQFANRANDSRLPVTAQTGWNGPIVPTRNPAQFPIISNVPDTQPWQGTAIPYTQPNLNAPAAISRDQYRRRQFEVATDVDNIKRALEAGKFTGGVGAYNPYDPRQYTEAQLAERAPIQAQIQQMTDFYNRPDVKEYLTSNPSLVAIVRQDPVKFYQQNAATMVPQGASTTPAQPQAGLRTQADAAAAAEEPINVGTQRRALIGDQQYLTLTERVAKGEDIPNFIYDANNTIPLQQHQRELQGLQIQYKRAQLGRNVAAMTEIENRVRAIQNDVSLLHGIQAINEMRAGSPENLARALYNVTGGRATIQQAANGTFNVYEGNKLVRQDVAPETLGNWSKAVFDTNFKTQVAQLREAKAAQDKQIFDAHIKGLEETLKQQAIGSKEGALKAIEFDLKRTYPDYDVKLDPEGKGVWVVNKSNPNDSRFIKLEEQIINGKKQFLPKVY